MTILANPASAQWNNPEQTSFDVSIVIPGYADPIRHTVNIGDFDFPDGALVAWGEIAQYAPPVLAPKLLATMAKEQRILRVHIAYGDPEKRMSLYGYLGQLNAYAAQRELTPAETLDRETLIAAAEWEQSMLDAMGAIIARADINYIASNDAWPQMRDGLSASLTALADAS